MKSESPPSFDARIAAIPVGDGPDMTGEEARLCLPYSETAKWQVVLAVQMLKGGHRFKGPPGMREELEAKVRKKGLAWARAPHALQTYPSRFRMPVASSGQFFGRLNGRPPSNRSSPRRSARTVLKSRVELSSFARSLFNQPGSARWYAASKLSSVQRAFRRIWSSLDSRSRKALRSMPLASMSPSRFCAWTAGSENSLRELTQRVQTLMCSVTNFNRPNSLLHSWHCAIFSASLNLYGGLRTSHFSEQQL